MPPEKASSYAAGAGAAAAGAGAGALTTRASQKMMVSEQRILQQPGLEELLDAFKTKGSSKSVGRFGRAVRSFSGRGGGSADAACEHADRSCGGSGAADLHHELITCISSPIIIKREHEIIGPGLTPRLHTSHEWL